MKAMEAKERLDTAVVGSVAAKKITAGGDAGENRVSARIVVQFWVEKRS